MNRHFIAWMLALGSGLCIAAGSTFEPAQAQTPEPQCPIGQIANDLEICSEDEYTLPPNPSAGQDPDPQPISDPAPEPDNSQDPPADPMVDPAPEPDNSQDPPAGPMVDPDPEPDNSQVAPTDPIVDTDPAPDNDPSPDPQVATPDQSQPHEDAHKPDKPTAVPEVGSGAASRPRRPSQTQRPSTNRPPQPAAVNDFTFAPAPRQLPELVLIHSSTLDPIIDTAQANRVNWANLAAWMEMRQDDLSVLSDPLTATQADALRSWAKLLSKLPPQEADAIRRRAALYRALGPAGVSLGMQDPDVQKQLATRVITASSLEDRPIDLYSGGVQDIELGRIDPRVLTVLLYLRELAGGVSVSSLQSGHGTFTASGNVSLHSRGQAVDIYAFAGENVLGRMQGPSRTLDATQDVLALPTELAPSELISLYALGGPSFAMSDHHDHMHVGFS